MNKLPKNVLVVVISLIVIGLVGGGLWYWFSQQLNTLLEEKVSLQEQLQGVEKKGIFPSTVNKKKLEDQAKELLILSDKVHPDILKRIELFSSVRTIDPKNGEMSGLTPDRWKGLFETQRNELRKQAEDKKITLPEDFNFSFNSYVLAAPRQENTLDLGVQLVAINEISKILINASVNQVLGFKRVMVEQKDSEAGRPPSTPTTRGSTVKEESLAASVEVAAEGTYRTIPFEITFRSSAQSLTQVLNALSKSQFLFVTKYVVIENDKSAVPRKSEFIQASQSGSGAAESPDNKVKKKVLIPVVGQELMITRMRVDLIDFLPPTNKEGVKKKP